MIAAAGTSCRIKVILGHADVHSASPIWRPAPFGPSLPPFRSYLPNRGQSRDLISRFKVGETADLSLIVSSLAVQVKRTIQRGVFTQNLANVSAAARVY